jgi:hypothetical protein
MIAPEWGWGAEDSAQALGLLSRFGSVTVLNGHIHQLTQKVEGNVTFHIARSMPTAAGAGNGACPGTEAHACRRIAQMARRPRGRLCAHAHQPCGH